jgi:hypothetical protein
MVIFIGLFYLVSIGSAVFQVTTSKFDWNEMKMLVLSVFYLISGILFLLKRNAGWIMSAGVLLNFVLVMVVFIFSISQQGAFSTAAAMGFFLFFLLLLAFLFLFGRNTRRKFAVNNKSYLITIGIYLLLIVANFLV